MTTEPQGPEGGSPPRGGPLSFWTGLKLWQKILIALVLGVAFGVALGEKAEYVKPVGSLFINLIKMLIVPLVFASLVTGVCSMDDIKKMGRIGAKTFGIYILTTAVAISIGLVIGILLEPGAGVGMKVAATKAAATEAPSLLTTLLNVVPRNPVAALSQGVILQIIVFAMILGVSISLSGEVGKPVARLFESFAEVMYRMTNIVMAFAPYGVFGLMAWVAGKYGLEVLLPLGKVIFCAYLGSALHVLLTLTGVGIVLLGRLNPVRYLRGILDAQVVAFTTTSSSGTLPVTMECARTNLGVSKPVASFVLPLGATINMDGTALYQGVAALFVAQAYGVELTTAQYITIIVTATLASIGTAGVPGGGLIMLSLVLTSVGLPLDGVAILAGVDRILDMARATVNVTGDLMVAVLIAKNEGELDEEAYNRVSLV